MAFCRVKTGLPNSPLALEDWPFLKLDCLWVYRRTEPSGEGRELYGSGHPGARLFANPHVVFFVEEGEVEFRSGKERFRCGEGFWFFGRPGVLSRHRTPGGARLLSVAFSAFWLNGLPLFSNGLNQPVPGTEIPNLYKASMDMFKDYHGEDVEEAGGAQSMQRKPLSLEEYLRKKTGFYRWFSVLIESFQTLGIEPLVVRPECDRTIEIAEMMQRLSLSERIDKSAISRRVGLSWRRIEQLFRERFGVTPHVLFERRRVAEAKRLLVQTDQSMKEIAFSLGFSQPSGFTIWFRRLMRISPSGYRGSVQGRLGKTVDSGRINSIGGMDEKSFCN